MVARHLAMAARLIDTEPALAHRHAQAASRKAGRVGVVRETVGLTAYATGDFSLALRELRTFRRITGSNTQVPIMADCERALGRPHEALELARSVPLETLPVEVQVDLAIVKSGARLDLGEDEEALVELEIPQLDPNTAYRYSPRLYRAYAEVLSGMGRDEESATWVARAEVAEELFGIDADGNPLAQPEDDVEVVELPDVEYADAEGEADTDAEEVVPVDANTEAATSVDADANSDAEDPVGSDAGHQDVEK